MTFLKLTRFIENRDLFLITKMFGLKIFKQVSALEKQGRLPWYNFKGSFNNQPLGQTHNDGLSPSRY